MERQPAYRAVGLAAALPRPLRRPRRAAPDRSGRDRHQQQLRQAGDETVGRVGICGCLECGFFGWEYKSKGGDLKAAYKQLANYHEDLENPALLVVCDFVRFEVRTKFENSLGIAS